MAAPALIVLSVTVSFTSSLHNRRKLPPSSPGSRSPTVTRKLTRVFSLHEGLPRHGGRASRRVGSVRSAVLRQRLAADPTTLASAFAEAATAGVLFADISGFTALSERLAERGPEGVEELTPVLNGYFGQLIDLISAHGGDMVKFAGDALLAF
jgi:class 3 adenylate cyclase